MTLPVERLVAEWNVQRYLRGERRELDLVYLVSMSADAWPAIARLAQYHPEARRVIDGAYCGVSDERMDVDRFVSGRRVRWVLDRRLQSTNILESLWCARLPGIREQLRAAR